MVEDWLSEDEDGPEFGERSLEEPSIVAQQRNNNNETFNKKNYRRSTRIYLLMHCRNSLNIVNKNSSNSKFK